MLRGPASPDVTVTIPIPSTIVLNIEALVDPCLGIPQSDREALYVNAPGAAPGLVLAVWFARVWLEGADFRPTNTSTNRHTRRLSPLRGLRPHSMNP